MVMALWKTVKKWLDLRPADVVVVDAT